MLRAPVPGLDKQTRMLRPARPNQGLRVLLDDRGRQKRLNHWNVRHYLPIRWQDHGCNWPLGRNNTGKEQPNDVWLLGG
ncbi:MAG: hypothetical protein ACKPKO_26765, partial [Candidatus Fonsibacter sp.]